MGVIRLGVYRRRPYDGCLALICLWLGEGLSDLVGHLLAVTWLHPGRLLAAARAMLVCVPIFGAFARGRATGCELFQDLFYFFAAGGVTGDESCKSTKKRILMLKPGEIAGIRE